MSHRAVFKGGGGGGGGGGIRPPLHFWYFFPTAYFPSVCTRLKLRALKITNFFRGSRLPPPLFFPYPKFAPPWQNFCIQPCLIPVVYKHTSPPSHTHTLVETPSPQVGLVNFQTQQQQQQQQHHIATTPVVQASSDGRRSKTRTSINPQQLEVLMQTYAHEQRPSKQTREELMTKTGLDMKVGVFVGRGTLILFLVHHGFRPLTWSCFIL